MEIDYIKNREFTHLWSINLQQSKQEYTMEKTVSSTRGAGKTGQLHEKEWNRTFSFCHIHKNKLKWIKNLNVKSDTKFLEENVGWILFDNNCSSILKKLGINLPHDPGTPLLDFCSEKTIVGKKYMYSNVHSNTVYNS